MSHIRQHLDQVTCASAGRVGPIVLPNNILITHASGQVVRGEQIQQYNAVCVCVCVRVCVCVCSHTRVCARAKTGMF
jgi:hypothetical protein